MGGKGKKDKEKSQKHKAEKQHQKPQKDLDKQPQETPQGTLNSETTRHKNLIPILICLTLVILTVITFWPIKNCDFINFDDNVFVYENGHVQNGLSVSSIKWAFSTNSTLKVYWHPMTWLSLMTDSQLFGLTPQGYHLMNLFFHICNTILLFLIFNRMTKALWQSVVIAAIFAVHPLHVESVAWITERKDVLSTFFWMLTMGVYVFYTERRTAGIYILALALFVLSLMSKPMVVTLPFALILLDYWPLNRFSASLSTTHKGLNWSQISRIIVEKIPFLILSILFSVITYIAQRNSGSVGIDISMIDRINNALDAYIVYLYKMVWPSGLAIFYPNPPELSVWQILCFIFILLSITGFSLWARKKLPFFIVGWFWYLGTLLPVIGIIKSGGQAYADRYTYIPLIGIFIMIVWGASYLAMRVRYRQNILGAASFFLIVIFVIISRIQVGYWQNSMNLMTHALAVTQNNYVAHTSLGLVFMKDGQTDEAIKHLNEAIRINPQYAYAHNDLALLLTKQGKIAEALSQLNEAIQINPNFAEAYNNLGDVLRRINRNTEAIEACQKALEIDPYFAEAHSNLAAALFHQGDVESAMSHLLTAIAIKPNLAEAHFILAVIYTSQGKLDQAIEHFQSTIRLNPDIFQAHYYLGVIMVSQGRYNEAIQHFQDTLNLRPDFEKARIGLRNVMNLQRKTP